MSLVKAIFKRIPGQQQTVALLRLAESYLAEKGWNESAKRQKPVNADGQPIPWLTYSFIDFLAPRLTPTMRVFEYGSGNSTLWFSERVGGIVSVEHDKAWYEFIGQALRQRKNVTYHFRDLVADDYPATIKEQTHNFDIVLIDGRKRVACSYAAVERLSEDGIIIWDNADRSDYQEGYDMLRAKGFRRIDFKGLSPGMHFDSSTAVFYSQQKSLVIYNMF
ncbi:MAG: FkbM family methyltransferase [Bacteroidota bacterium]